MQERHLVRQTGLRADSGLTIRWRAGRPYWADRCGIGLRFDAVRAALPWRALLAIPEGIGRALTAAIAVRYHVAEALLRLARRWRIGRWRQLHGGAALLRAAKVEHLVGELHLHAVGDLRGGRRRQVDTTMRSTTQFRSSALAAHRPRRSRAVLFGLAVLGIHTVTFTVSINNFTHFNANTPQGQIELGPNVRQFSFRNGPSGQLESFALQACSKNLFSSRCTAWATFTHTPQ